MHSIESELHKLLDDVASSCYTLDEQSRIIAEASAIVHHKFAQPKMSKIATKNAQFREAQMLDALMQSMGYLVDDSVDENGLIDATGLDNKAIIAKASRLPRHAYTLLNESDLAMFSDDFNEKSDGGFFDIDDDIHDPELYRKPGIGRHRSDPQNR